jgi:hypothetical protein
MSGGVSCGGTSVGLSGETSGGSFCGGTSAGLSGGISGLPLFIVLSPFIGIAFVTKG